MAPLSEVAPFSKTGSTFKIGCKPKRLHTWSQNGSINQDGDVSDLLLGENSSTFESGTKLVRRVELSYVPLNSSRGGAILAPLFFSV